MSFAKLPDSYRLTQADMAICEKASARVWLNDPSNGTADDWLLDDISNAATLMREATGKLPTIGEIRAQWTEEKRQHDLRQYQSARSGGGLYCSQMGQIYWFPELLPKDKRARLEREQREALR